MVLVGTPLIETAEGGLRSAEFPTTSLQPPTSNLQPLPHAGFTFVELLIAATMMSILFLGLAAHLRGGIMVWRRSTEGVEALRRERVALERLARDFANAIVYDDRPESYGTEEGQLPSVQFGEATLSWFTVSPASSRQGPTLQLVRYACEPIDGAGSPWVVRSRQSIGEGRAHRQPSREPLVPGCQALSLRYAYLPSVDQAASPAEPLEWHAPWTHPEHALPSLVEVSISWTSGGTITRVFAIPTGVLTAVGETAP